LRNFKGPTKEAEEMSEEKMLRESQRKGKEERKESSKTSIVLSR
jgi:hypothetical protein